MRLFWVISNFFTKGFIQKKPKMQTNDLHLDDLHALKDIKKQFYS